MSLGHITTYAYDGTWRNKTVKSVKPTESNIRWYDDTGASVERTPAPQGVAATFKSDHNGRLVKEEWENGISFLYTYSPDGTTCYKQGPEGTVTALPIVPSAAARSVTYSYDVQPCTKEYSNEPDEIQG